MAAGFVGGARRAIKSIIAPSLADHVLREAVRFSDEVRRAG
ncbi:MULTISPECIES: DUF2935 domain-containing protein [Sorangium]|nr:MULTISPECIES: DUF2935 domain-containing protein [Sorangium]